MAGMLVRMELAVSRNDEVVVEKLESDKGAEFGDDGARRMGTT